MAVCASPPTVSHMRPRPLLEPAGTATRDARLAASAEIAGARLDPVVSLLSAYPPSPFGYGEEVPGVIASRTRTFHHGACPGAGRRNWPALRSAESLAAAGEALCAVCSAELFGPAAAAVAAFDEVSGPVRDQASLLLAHLQSGLFAPPAVLAALFDAWVHGADVCDPDGGGSLASVYTAWRAIEAGLGRLLERYATELGVLLQRQAVADAAQIVALTDRRAPAGWDRRSQWRLEEARRRAWRALQGGAAPEEIRQQLDRAAARRWPSKASRSAHESRLLSTGLQAAAAGAVDMPSGAQVELARFVVTGADTHGGVTRHPFGLSSAVTFGKPELTRSVLGDVVAHRLAFHGQAPGIVVAALAALGEPLPGSRPC